jgi:hypothetical protein
MPASISMNAFAVAGAKVPHLFTFPRLFVLFFRCFLHSFPNSLITAGLYPHLFYNFVGFFLLSLRFCPPTLSSRQRFWQIHIPTSGFLSLFALYKSTNFCKNSPDPLKTASKIHDTSVNPLPFALKRQGYKPTAGNSYFYIIYYTLYIYV